MESYLNKDIECSCGHTHHIPIKKVLVEERALKKVPTVLDDIGEMGEKRRVYLVVDDNTYTAAGSDLENYLEKSNYEVETIILQTDRDHLRPDTVALFEILSRIEKEGYILACGSGTINDLTRYAAYKMGRPYSIVATAPSMDGYASSVASLIVDGVKKTYRAVPPEAIIADLDVLRQAPWQMIQAGFGDLLGKNTSLLDWKLSRIIFGEYYCQESVQLVQEELEKIMRLGSKLKHRSRDSLEALTLGLIKSGLAMLMIGSSRPASGSEHHLSHFLEMYGFKYKVETPPHGIKVALGTCFTSTFYLWLKEVDFARIRVTDDKEARAQAIKENYPGMSELMLALLEERWDSEKLSREDLLKKEGEIKQLIAEHEQDLAAVKNYVEAAGIYEREDVRALSNDWLEKALKYGFEIRNRFTVSTLLKKMGLLEKWSEKVVGGGICD